VLLQGHRPLLRVGLRATRSCTTLPFQRSVVGLTVAAAVLLRTIRPGQDRLWPRFKAFAGHGLMRRLHESVLIPRSQLRRKCQIEGQWGTPRRCSVGHNSERRIVTWTGRSMLRASIVSKTSAAFRGAARKTVLCDPRTPSVRFPPTPASTMVGSNDVMLR
jgi:hypothetical protein